MGKTDGRQIGFSAAVTSAPIDSPPPSRPFLDGVRRVSSIRCVIVLLLTIGVLISTVLWILPITSLHTSVLPHDDALSAEIQASFILQKPFVLLTSHVKRLEYDIFEEIGVPNTKVSIIHMHPTPSINSTDVIFGIFPEPKHASISPPALSLLRSSLIELVVKQINLTLTPSIFGETMSFEILKFPGGITIIPLQTAFIWERTKALFNFTISNSVAHIQENMKKLTGQLKYGLNLRPYENVYVQMTNVNGSTIAPPVILQASILSNYGNGALLPNRLKQLADSVEGFHVQNLGLNHSVFGDIKSVILSSYLNKLISSSEALSASLSPTSSPSPSPIATPYTSRSEDCPYTVSIKPCFHSIVKNDLQPPCFFCGKISTKGILSSNHITGSQPTYPSNSGAVNQSLHREYKLPRLTTHSAHAVFYDSNLLVQDKESIKASTPNMSDSFVSSSSTSFLQTINALESKALSGIWLFNKTIA